jgi:hypothetical protein
MEFLKEAIASRNIVVWILIVVFLILFIKLLKSVGKGFLLLLFFGGIIFILVQAFPGFMDPVIDFVQGGWLGDQRPDKGW